MYRGLFSHSLFCRMLFSSKEIAVLGISMRVSSPSSRCTSARYPSRWSPEKTRRIKNVSGGGNVQKQQGPIAQGVVMTIGSVALRVGRQGLGWGVAENNYTNIGF